MSTGSGIARIHLENFRIHKNLLLECGSTMVFFGPNGSGKTTLLSSLGLLHHFIATSSETAFGIHGDVASDDDPAAPTSLSVGIGPTSSEYQLKLSTLPRGIGYRIAERVIGSNQQVLVERNDSKVFFPGSSVAGLQPVAELPEPSRSSLELLQALSHDPSVPEIRQVLRGIRSYRCLDFQRAQLLRSGAELSVSGAALHPLGMNLWSVLRNLKDVRATRELYDNLLVHIRRAFPGFDDFEFIQSTGNVFCRIAEHGRPSPYPALRAPDGLIQFALVMAVLFSDGIGSFTILLDEPDLSLHPWAQSVLAEAIQDATQNWQRQVILATHSPTLLNAFPVESLFLTESVNGESRIRCLADVDDARSLLESYGAGHLYMSQLIGEQSAEPMAEVIDADE